jgi:hypothetical protein
VSNNHRLDVSEKLILLIKVSGKQQLVGPSTCISCLIPQLCVEVDGDAENMMNRSDTEIEFMLIEQVLNI